jgi:ABC-type Mn2+/Zn2+ transport system ATPase subunit
MELTDVVIDYGSTRVGPVTSAIPAGSVTVLQGPSGSGKTSLCLAMTGFLAISGGRIDGELGVLVPQNPREWLNPRHTVAEVIARTRTIRGIGAADGTDGGSRESGRGAGGSGVGPGDAVGGSGDSAEILERSLLGPELAGRRCGELSGGQAARVCIARALASGIDTIVCDEPTAALDSSNAARIARLINDLAAAGKTLVWATHDRDLVAATDDGYSFVNL